MIPGNAQSYWIDTIKRKDYPQVTKDFSIDTLIIGGGITGIACAYFLKDTGSIAVIEKNQLFSGTTGYTTAKITSLHGLKYHYLLSKFGEEKALVYAESNQWAIEEIEKIVKENKIECDFKRVPSYTYGARQENIKLVRKEYEAAVMLDLPAEFVEDLNLPFKTAGAVKFNNQALFHPLNYLVKLADILTNNNVQIYENSKAIEIDEENLETALENGKKINAKNIIIATNYPIYDKKKFYLKMKQMRSYAYAVELNKDINEGMYLGIEEDEISIRPQLKNSGKVYIVGGGEHITGEVINTTKMFQDLENNIRKRLPIKSFLYHWAAQDSSPYDKIPYIGQDNNVYVATGFGEWGMTTSHVAAKIISDLIIGNKNPWTDFYSPGRIKLSEEVKNLAGQVKTVVKQYKKRVFQMDEIKNLKNNQGTVIKKDNKPAAVYKDEKGQVHAVSAVCTHMGCTVEFNNAEKSWDCPCHGSRFDVDGKVIQSPATQNLEKVNID